MTKNILISWKKIYIKAYRLPVYFTSLEWKFLENGKFGNYFGLHIWLILYLIAGYFMRVVDNFHISKSMELPQ